MEYSPEQLYISRAAEVTRNWLMSHPRAQFESHLLDEAQAMIQAMMEGLCYIETDHFILEIARSVVQKRWQAAGLWLWDPLLRSPPVDAQWPLPRPVNTAPCAATAPAAVFTLEMGVQRWRLGLRGGRGTLDALDEVLPANINDLVYGHVRAEWERRGIWDPTWACLPGQLWKHQRSLEDVLLEQLGEPPVGVTADHIVPLGLAVAGGLGIFLHQPFPGAENREGESPPPAYEQHEPGDFHALSPVRAVSPRRPRRRRDRMRPDSRAAVEYRRRQRRRERARLLSPNPYLGRGRAF